MQKAVEHANNPSHLPPHLPAPPSHDASGCTHSLHVCGHTHTPTHTSTKRTLSGSGQQRLQWLGVTARHGQATGTVGDGGGEVATHGGSTNHHTHPVTTQHKRPPKPTRGLPGMPCNGPRSHAARGAHPGEKKPQNRNRGVRQYGITHSKTKHTSSGERRAVGVCTPRIRYPSQARPCRGRKNE